MLRVTMDAIGQCGKNFSVFSDLNFKAVKPLLEHKNGDFIVHWNKNTSFVTIWVTLWITAFYEKAKSILHHVVNSERVLLFYCQVDE